MSYEFVSPQVDAALIGGCVAALGWWLSSWRVGKKIESIREAAQHRLEGVRLVNDKDLAFLKAELESLSAHVVDRRRLLLALLNSVHQAKDAAWSLVNDSASLEPRKLLSKTAQSLQAISAFFASTGNAESIVFLTDDERDQLAVVAERLSELFLSLDLDSGRRSDYERILLDTAKRLDKEVEKFQRMAKVAFPTRTLSAPVAPS